MKIDDKTVYALADILAEAARQEIMPRFRNLGDGAIRTKTSLVDLVTEADEAAERAIISAGRNLFPDAAFIGEEGVEKDRSLLSRVGEVDFSVIIDPIDGTMNFASGLPLFGVMAAIVVKGETVAGIIHDPIIGDWAIAIRGEGAHVRGASGEKTPLRCASPAPVEDMIGSASTQFFEMDVRRRILSNLADFAGFCGLRNAAHEYRLMASGGLHFLMYNKLMPWDHLAGSLIVTEAGGHVARLDGSPYRPGDLEGGLLVAPDPQSWLEIRETLLKE